MTELQPPRLSKYLLVKTLTLLKEFQEYASIKISGYNLEGSFFTSSQAQSLYFKNCVLRMATFEEATLDDTFFQRCDLTNTDLRNTNLDKDNFRESTLDGLRVSPKDMQGTIISPIQAIQVASLLAVTVMEEGL